METCVVLTDENKKAALRVSLNGIPPPYPRIPLTSSNPQVAGYKGNIFTGICLSMVVCG